MDRDRGETGCDEREEADPWTGDPDVKRPKSDRNSAQGADSEVAEESEPGKRLLYAVEGEVIGVE